MAYHIQIRHDPAATWTSVNPVLKSNEPGIETDTGRFKVGDGSTAWNSLSYKETQGPTQTLIYRSFGDGSDGNVTISSGTTTLTRDMFYNNLTMSGTGKIVTNGYKIFIKSILDITAASSAAIQWNGNSGNNGSGATGGTTGAAQSAGTLGTISTGGTGTTATTGNGTAGGTGLTISGNGGIGGGGGNAGDSSINNGGNGAAGRTPLNSLPTRRYETNLIVGATLLSGGGGGGGGAAGAGDGVGTGGGGGAGGNGGGVMAIYVDTIIKGSNTPADVIQATGGNGGNAGNGAASNTGGGGGGGAGGGGWVYMCYNSLIGPTILNLINASGGNGGIGGSGTGTGKGGQGGDGGSGGRITLINVPTSTATVSIGESNINIIREITGDPAVGTAGGTGGFGGTLKASL